jgi:glucose-specific phosphotransferase system IIA component
MNLRGIMQRTAKALMVPIVVMPVAAIFMAVGSQLGLDFVDAAGSSIIVQNLPLLFAVGVAIGFTGGDGMAAFAAVVGHVVLVAVMRSINPGMTVGDRFIPNEMSVLGGIMVGGYTAALWHRFKDIRFPEYLGLFSGKRFVPIVTALASLGTGIFFGNLWPPVNQAILAVGDWIFATGGYGIFVYGLLNRLLIPTGLHHILQNLVLHIFGSYVTEGGQLVTGELARFFAGDPTAGYFPAGFFITMIFALPAAALAIVHESKSPHRKRVAGIMLTAALTSIITGITEPAEFTFIFTAPLLFLVHGILTGAALLGSWALGIRHYGYALPMFFINLGLAENPWRLIPLGAIFSLVYYFLFRYLIRRFNYLTPGREPEQSEIPEESSSNLQDIARVTVAALGGWVNLDHVDACLTRLRVTVFASKLVDRDALKKLPAMGISFLDHNNIQIILGTASEQIRDAIKQELAIKGILKLQAPVDGQVIPLSSFPDPVFAQEMVGIGVGFMPSGDTLTAPMAGEIVRIFPGGHALVMKTSSGLEILLHIGLDTVDLNGRGFEKICADGQLVEAGQVLIRFDKDLIAQEGKALHTALIITNKEAVETLAVTDKEKVKSGSNVLFVQKK